METKKILSYGVWPEITDKNLFHFFTVYLYVCYTLEGRDVSRNEVGGNNEFRGKARLFCQGAVIECFVL